MPRAFLVAVENGMREPETVVLCARERGLVGGLEGSEGVIYFYSAVQDGLRE